MDSKEFRPFHASDDWLDNPDFDRPEKVHDWRNHMGQHTMDIWQKFTREQKIAIARDAQNFAMNEDWD